MHSLHLGDQLVICLTLLSYHSYTSGETQIFLTMAHYGLVCTRIPLSTIQTMPLNILYTYIFALLYITTLLSLSTKKSVGVEIRSSLSLEDTNPLIGASPRCVERNKYTTRRLRMGSKQVPLSCMENVSLPNVQKT